MIERGGPHGVERPAAVPPQVPCDLPLPGAEPSAQLGAGHVRTRGRQKPVPSSWTMSSAAARPALSVMLIVSDADAAVRWYTTALGAAQLWDLGGVAGLDLGGAPFFVHEAVPGKNQEPSPIAVGLTTAPSWRTSSAGPARRCVCSGHRQRPQPLDPSPPAEELRPSTQVTRSEHLRQRSRPDRRGSLRDDLSRPTTNSRVADSRGAAARAGSMLGWVFVPRLAMSRGLCCRTLEDRLHEGEVAIPAVVHGAVQQR